MIKRISALELVNKTELEFDIYDANGNVICAKGQILTPEKIMQLNFIPIYAKEEELPQMHTKNYIKLKQTDTIQSVVPEEMTKSLIKNAKNILFKVFDDKTPDEKVYTETRDMILEEVSSNIDKIDCIGQLRVYDEYTYSHTVNVSSMATALAILLNYSQAEIEEISLGALLHDIGKIRVAKTILNKPAKLNDEEFYEIKKHTIFGYNIVKDEMGLKEDIARVALEHQEKWGGFGYPSGLVGEEIHPYAQITAVCDVYDALVSKRVYKEPVRSHEALEIMINDGSKAFNPKILYKMIYLANFKDATALKISESL